MNSDSLLRHSRSHAPGNTGADSTSSTHDHAGEDNSPDSILEGTYDNENPNANPENRGFAPGKCPESVHANSGPSVPAHPVSPPISGLDYPLGDLIGMPLASGELSATSSEDVSSGTFAGHLDGHLADNDSGVHESVWGLGGEFDLDVLSGSISAFMDEWCQPSLTGPSLLQPNSTNTTSCSLKRAPPHIQSTSEVHDNWFTRVKWESCHHESSTVPDNQEVVDNNYRESLSNRLRPPVSNAVLPSADFLVRSFSCAGGTHTLLFTVHAKVALESMFEAIFHQIQPRISHRPQAHISALLGECSPPAVNLFYWFAFCWLR